MRQKFTGYEHDAETNLDYAQARYYASVQGRFTSPDPLLSSGKLAEPQSWNRYTYCLNNPLVYIDPDGLLWYMKDGGDRPEWFNNDPGEGYKLFSQRAYYAGEQHGWVRLNRHSSGWTSGYGSEQAALATESFSDTWTDFTNQVKKSFTLQSIGSDARRIANDPLGAVTETGLAVGMPNLLGSLGGATRGVGVASGMGDDAAEMTVVRIIERGEKIEEIVDKAKHLTLITNNEHALVTLAGSGQRALVSGGPSGIHFGDKITRLFGHTHPPGSLSAGPSGADRAALKALGQRSSWLVERGQTYKFWR